MGPHFKSYSYIVVGPLRKLQLTACSVGWWLMAGAGLL
jgi:hypothetical protein